MIEQHADVRAWFRERLVGALQRRRMRADERTEFYLVGLLADFAICPPVDALTRPLASQLAEALEVDGPERLRRYRALGDVALYTSGFFEDHFERRGISSDYVRAIGERAYLSASAAARFSPRDVELASVWDELGEKFGGYAAVIGDVKESTTLRTPQDIVRLYDRWKRTRSPAIAERLRAVGVFPALEADATGRRADRRILN
jgi:hypothetical protein